MKKNLKNACGQILRLSWIFSLLLILGSIFVSAETILVEPGSEDQILDTETDPEHEVQSGIPEGVVVTKEAMKELIDATKDANDQKEYLKAINKRGIELENKYEENLDALTESNHEKDETIKKQDEKIGKLESEVQGLNAQVVGIDSQLNIYKKFGLPIVAFVSIFLTVLFMEFTYGLTRRKKLYFKLRNIRDNLPLNFGVLLGRDKE